MPTNQDNQLQTLQRKRKEYFVMVNTYIENPSLEQDAQEKKIFKLINDDVLRTLPESNLFRNERIQKIMRR
jgi:TBC1 domain family member 2